MAKKVAALLVVAVVLVAVASGLGGYALGRHSQGDGSERQTAMADALEIIGAYNLNGSGQEYHLVWIGKAAPNVWRFRVKENGKKHFGCVQVNVKQFWHGQGTDFHGFGNVDSRQCPPWAGA
jgi:hypothetical protein